MNCTKIVTDKCQNQFLWSMDSNTFRSSFKMTIKLMIVTFSTIFFFLSHLEIGRQRYPKSLG